MYAQASERAGTVVLVHATWQPYRMEARPWRRSGKLVHLRELGVGSTTPSCYKEPAQVAHAFHRESYSKDFGLDRNSSRYILYVIWPAINSGSPRRSLEMLLGKRKSGIFCLMCFYNDPTLDKRKKIKDGLVVNTIFFYFDQNPFLVD